MSDIAEQLRDIANELEDGDDHDCAENCDHDHQDNDNALKNLDKLLKLIEKGESLELVLVAIGETPLLTLRELRDELESIREDL